MSTRLWAWPGRRPIIGAQTGQACAVSAGPDSFNEIGAASFFRGPTRPSVVEMTGSGFRKVIEISLAPLTKMQG